MFGLLRDVGQYLSPDSTNPVKMLTEPIGDNYYYGVAICFNPSGLYQGVRLQTGSKGVLFKNPHSSTPYSYTLVLRHSGKVNNVYERLKKNAEKICENFPKSENISLLRNCISETDNKKDKIISDIEDIIPEDASQKKRVYLYWGLIEKEVVKGFYEFPEVQEFLVRTKMNIYGTKDNTPLQLTNHICSVCGIKAEKVYGNFTEIQCYNLDKMGSITGGFNYARAPANFPICEECILYVLAGKNYAKQNLSFSLAGYSYWLLPQASTPDLFKVILSSIEESHSRQSLGKELDTITARQDEILDIIANKMELRPELLTLNLIFYEEKQAAWRIKSEIREVLPSRIKALYEAKKKIQIKEEMPISKKERENKYYFTLKAIHPFCGDSGKQSEQKFLTYIETIFKGGKLQEDIVLRDLANGIIDAQKSDLKNKSNFSPLKVRDGWATYLFLSEIDSLVKKGGNIMSKRSSAENRYYEYMSENPEFFNDKYRRTAFLTGCFINSVLYIQRKKRNSQPFAKKFMGRKLNGKIIRDLYTQGETKLRQYEALGIVGRLNPLVADSWVSCGDLWEITDDETTFAFTLGVTLGPKLASIKYEGNEVKK